MQKWFRDETQPHHQPTADVERLYYSSIASPYTQKSYRTYLSKYLAFYGMKEVGDLLTKDHKQIENEIINFIIWAKEKGMKRGAILNYTAPVISFCKINDIMVTNQGEEVHASPT